MALKNIIGLDHVVVVTRELDQAAENWKQLGFTVSPRGTHSAKMGTGNFTIMLEPDYIELLGVLTETEHNASTRGFVARRGDGIERIAFTAIDASAGAEEIRARGYAPVGPTDFERPVTMPDGSQSAAKFTTFQWPVEETPGGFEFFACQHETRENGLDSGLAATRQCRETPQARAGGFARTRQGCRAVGADDRPRG